MGQRSVEMAASYNFLYVKKSIFGGWGGWTGAEME